MTYNSTQLLALDSQYRVLSAKLLDHFAQCGDCFIFHHEGDQLSCSLTVLWFDELASIAEVLNRPTHNFYSTQFYYFELSADQADEKAIQDFQYELGVADYITTSHERPTNSGKWEPDNFAEHFAEIQDSWLTSQAGQEAVKDTSDYRDSILSEEVSATIVNATWAATLGYFAEEPDGTVTQANLKAHCRIWSTKRGEVGIYKTFISEVTEDSFKAYCGPCHQGFRFTHSSKKEMVTNVIKVMRHAHTHLPNSTLTFYESSFSIEGSDAVSSTDDYLKRGISQDLQRYRSKWNLGQLSDKELELAKAYSQTLSSLK